MKKGGKFHDKLKYNIHQFISRTYNVKDQFPKDERFGLISQLSRASISIMLNYVEGYARRRDKVKLNFYEISHGSAQECKYIIFFAHSQRWITEDQYKDLLARLDEIGKMLWSTINLLERKINNV